MKRFVHIHAADEESLHRMVRDHSLDFGCRATAIPHDEGGFIVPAVVTEDEHQTLSDHGFTVHTVSNGLTKDRLASTTVAEGDRFHGGSRVPVGAGTVAGGGDSTHGIMNVDEIVSALKALASQPGATPFTPPNASHGGELVGGVTVGPEAPKIFFIGGTHARERGGPDQLLYFVADLLKASHAASGLTYGAKTYTAAEVSAVVAAGVGILPLVNPDGVRWDQKTDSLWRKNRNPASQVPGRPETIGVDINRNYDYLWDFRKHFDPTVVETGSLASDDPAGETFHGTAPMSEPETRNVAWLLDEFPTIRWFMDVHSAVGDILYAWSDDNNQSKDPTQNFQNPEWDGRRGVLGGGYGEWMAAADQKALSGVAREVAGSMHAVGGRAYRPTQACGLYASSGTSDGYTVSRSHIDPTKPKIISFGMEFGRPTNFYPNLSEFAENVTDTGSGFMQFCLSALARPNP